MTAEAEQLNQGESKAEEMKQPEIQPEKPENEAELKKLAESVTVQIESQEQDVLSRAEKNIEPPISLRIEKETAESVLGSGFGKRIQAVKDGIITLAQMTKDKVTALIGGQPEVIHFKDMAGEASQLEARQSSEVAKAESVEHGSGIKDFSEILKQGDALVSGLTSEDRMKVANTTAEMAAIADVAREMANESHGLETVGPKTEAVDQTSAHRLAKGESIVDKENPFTYMAAVRVSNNLPVFENGKLVLKTAFDMTNGQVPRLTLHLTVNCRVGNNDGGNWDDVGYAFVMPMDKLVEANGKPYAFGKDDTFFATSRGVEIPATSKIIYRADKKDDPTFQALIEQCRQNNIPVEFIESEASDDTAVERILEESGYGNYTEGNDKDVIDRTLSDKMGVRMGGYGAHTGSPIWELEKSFLYGQPSYETDNASQQQLVSNKTPFNQLTAVSGSPEDIPQDVKDRYTALAKTNLESLLTDSKKFESFATNNGESRLGKGSASAFKEYFYGQAISSLLDKGKFMDDFFSRNPDTKNKIEAMVIAAADKPEIRGAFLEMLMNRKPEEIPTELKEGMIETNLQHGGFTSFQLLEYFPNLLSAEQQQKCKDGIMANLDTFSDSTTPELLVEYAEGVAQRKDYFSQKYGTALVEKFESHIKS